MENTENNLIIGTWFPVTIGEINCPFIHEIKDKYRKIISNYSYDENGFCNKQIHKEKQFNKLNQWITLNVNKYAKAHMYKYEYEAKDSWLLDYPIGKGQPFHAHQGYTISVVFYLEAVKEDSPTIFSNPFIDMKNPVGLTSRNEKNIELNNLSYFQCEYTCETGKLLIFRSHILHAVDPKIISNKRIIFSYNFDPK